MHYPCIILIFVFIVNKRYIKSKGQPIIDNLETQATSICLSYIVTIKLNGVGNPGKLYRTEDHVSRNIYT
jgi:hypothetical protein